MVERYPFIVATNEPGGEECFIMKAVATLRAEATRTDCYLGEIIVTECEFEDGSFGYAARCWAYPNE